MKVLLHPSYFPSISQLVVITNGDEVVFEKFDNYQKQTYRNRMYIYGANGKQLLSIPIKHISNNGRLLYKDVRLENDFPWQKQHWKSIETAYRTSPFFEYYEDEFAPLFENKHEFLLDFNLKTMEVIFDSLQLETNFSFTTKYETAPIEIKDHRFLINAKKEENHPLERYTQVFESKHGFIPNLSTLDLLFNEGPNSLNYLESQNILLQ
ncbi:hypothetical protein NBRC110019_13540 [Neptunitalea chrysea]|uniref:WbqC-like protein family protein n=1 Tax=Neptunitalea chrysea TaxID=1647581 RepID=A0A9W6B4E9_9FLAO|nr:WbqC family protein [Neptunitalea chrysea]GLB52315.1 hypothetical protein NBRC110019_13540 [Neptunitalea chrysea]